MQNSNILKNLHQLLGFKVISKIVKGQVFSQTKFFFHIMMCTPMHNLTYVQKGYMVNNLVVCY